MIISRDLVKRHERTLHADKYETGTSARERQAPSDSGNTCDDADGDGDGDIEMDSFPNVSAPDETLIAATSPSIPLDIAVPPDIQPVDFANVDFLSTANDIGPNIQSTDTFDHSMPSEILDGDLFDFSQPYDFLSDNFFDVSADVLLPNFPGADAADSNEPGSPSILRRRQSFVDSGVAYPYNGPTPTQELQVNRRIFEQLPRVLQESSASLPSLSFDDAAYEVLCRGITNYIGNDGELTTFAVSKDIQRFLNSYVDCFHRHLPFLHLASLLPAETPSPLLLAISSIGALYRLDRRRALLLFKLSNNTLLKAREQKSPGSAAREDPLWMYQARILLDFYAFFSGDTAIIEAAFSQVGYFTPVYRRIRHNLASNTSQPTSWEQWIEREARRRALCAMYIVSNLVVATYDVTPGFVNNTDLQFEAPEEEMLWNARTESNWRELSQKSASVHRKTVRDIMADVVSEHQYSDMEDAEPYKVPAFTMLVIMHAVCIHMWLSYHFAQMLGSRTSNMPVQRSLRIALLATTTSTLARCQKAISREGNEGQEISWDDPDGPLLFNCQALLRIAYTRQFTVVNSFNRLTLFNDDPSTILSSVNAYASARQSRNKFLTQAAASACQGFFSVIRIGHLLVRKTAALSWSPEHAIAGWDSGK